MPEPPEVPDEIAINEARNKLGPIIEKSRYFGGVTFLMNRGKRVAAIVPVEIGELIEESGDIDLLVTVVKNMLAARDDPQEPDSDR